MAEGKPSHLVFTYGTLKRGEPNEPQMAPEYGCAEFVGCGETKEKYPLVVATSFNVPFLLKEEGQGHNVRGEVYLVDDKMLEHLDVFEYHPKLYLRQEASISMTEDQQGNKITENQTKVCGVYFLSQRHEEMLKMNYISDYKSAAKDNLPYVTRENRNIQVSILEMVFPQDKASQ